MHEGDLEAIEEALEASRGEYEVRPWRRAGNGLFSIKADSETDNASRVEFVCGTLHMAFATWNLDPDEAPWERYRSLSEYVRSEGAHKFSVVHLRM